MTYSYIMDEKDLADGRDYKIKRSVMIGQDPREVHIQGEDCRQVNQASMEDMTVSGDDE